MNTFAVRWFLLGLAIAILPGLAALLAAPGGRPLVEKAYVGADGSVHIVETGRGDRTVPKEKGQVGSSELRIADDKMTVGWLAEYENCCTSYNIPLKLVVYRDGRVWQRIGNGLMIYDWRFWENGKQAAFCSGTVHGDSGGHCELHDVTSGRTLETLDEHLDEDSPDWAKGLRN